MERKDTIVFVGLSGGVDSSVAALRLKKQGYFVVGVFIKVWHPEFLECNWEQERLDAMRVAATLGIPFLTCDAEEEYEKDVAEYFIGEYKKGRTPNPDVMCNKYIKFGAFLRFAEKHGAHFIATGHYAQVKRVGDAYHLLRGVDTSKDQSYFLWTLTQEQLSKILLPIGDSLKTQIRKEAHEAGLQTAAKKDSQGICFLGHVDIAEFLSHYTSLQEGNVLNVHGEVIGRHKGALVYTSGQRHGFTIATHDAQRQPYYVIQRDIEHNTITVSAEKPLQTRQSSLVLREFNLIGERIPVGSHVEVQTRYRQQTAQCTCTDASDDTLTLKFNEESDQASAGQSCVLYEGMRCIGGGIIF